MAVMLVVFSWGVKVSSIDLDLQSASEMIGLFVFCKFHVGEIG